MDDVYQLGQTTVPESTQCYCVGDKALAVQDRAESQLLLQLDSIGMSGEMVDVKSLCSIYCGVKTTSFNYCSSLDF
ncbi:hypothetical protein KIN20_018886 [Parelaphostrongylus tenuis]|uniref:Uncharacterized protein n=1 Tax=Parelaphostrongylus tenuis TaxID=148309 RepID=A0AAD5QSE9_PARTN|nr:hypothetical protein KIN20_018886 [Parelaphostrongylus tenuis]